MKDLGVDAAASPLLPVDTADSCNCIADMDVLLKPMGGEILVNLFGLPRAFVSTNQLAVEKGKRRKKVPYLQATFCPFCGVRYLTKTEAR